MGTLELLLALGGEAGLLHQGQRLRDQRGHGDRGAHRREGRDVLDPAGHPVDRLPQGDRGHEVGEPAGDDEHPEGDEGPQERHPPTGATGEDDQGQGDRHIRDADREVGEQVQQQEHGVPSEGGALAQKSPRGKENLSNKRKRRGGENHHDSHDLQTA
jgi:hypothetical protein